MLLNLLHKVVLTLRYVTLCYGNSYGGGLGVTPVTLPLGVLRCYALGSVTPCEGRHG